MNKLKYLTLLFYLLAGCSEKTDQPAITEEKSSAADSSIEKYSVNDLLRDIQQQYSLAEKIALEKITLTRSDSANIEKAKKLNDAGFDDAALVKRTIDKGCQLRDYATHQYETIKYYKKNYPQFTFVYELTESIGCEKVYIASSAGPVIDVPPQIADKLKSGALKKFCLHNELGLFDATDYNGEIPDSAIDAIAKFNKKAIALGDLRYCSVNQIFFESFEQITEPIKDDTFKIIAPVENNLSRSDPVVLFPVKNGYFVVTYW